MANNNSTRTMAFQIGEDLFQRIKAHLERETPRTGRKLTQRDFVLGLIEKALNEAECQADPSPCEATETGNDTREQDTPGQGSEEPCEATEGLPASQDE